MIRYILLDPVTCQQRISTEFFLTRDLRLNYILLRDGEHIGIITHRDLVLFARWCAGVTLAQLEGEPDQRATYALSLVDRWLEDERSVTSEELEAARNAVWAAWNVDTTAAGRNARADSVWNASDASWATIAVAINAAKAVLWAITAANGANSAGIVSYRQQAQWLVEHLKSGK